MTDSFHAIGIDVGGTKVAAGVVSFPSGKVRDRRVFAVDGKTDAVFNQLVGIVDALAGSVRRMNGEISGIGLGLCEIITREGSIASNATFRWSDAQIAERLGSIAPLIIDADVRAAARAEALFGEGRGVNCFLYVSIGTGISSCLVLDGEPYTGARGATGTMASGPLLNLESRARVSLEELASGPAIRRRFAESGGNAINAQEVIAAAERGDKRALDIVRSAAAALGAAIGSLVNVLDPARIVLGGGLGLSTGLFREILVQSLREHIWWPGHVDLPVVPARTGVEAGMIGAAATAWKHFGKNAEAGPRHREPAS